ncbi:MAG: MerR family transcriptional regulator, partial [Chloroflexota bacterium]|nr:MerR family transcriptional regulator [Chloroflexota bacterium]
MLAARLCSALELMRLTGMTRKQVAYWKRIGLVRPALVDTRAGPGRPALFYAGTEVVKALIVCELRRRGFTPRQVKEVARNLEEHDVQLYESEAYLLTDGHSVYYAFNNTEVVDVLKHHRQLLLLLPVHEQV